MIDFFYGLNPYMQTLIASTIAFSFTVMGSAIVFFFKKINNTIMNAMLAISSGIMLAAAIFSLLLPAISEAIHLEYNAKLIIPLVFILGTLLLLLVEKKMDKYTTGESSSKFMLILSILLHNIPEGMSIGVAFASATYGIDNITVLEAISLSIAIGLQNFPEGAAVSLPLRSLGFTRNKAFIISNLTGSIEIISGLIGVLLVLKIKVIFPFLLAFAAVAMMMVVIKDLIPESLSDKHKALMTYLTIIGFTLMMILEI